MYAGKSNALYDAPPSHYETLKVSQLQWTHTMEKSLSTCLSRGHASEFLMEVWRSTGSPNPGPLSGQNMRISGTFIQIWPPEFVPIFSDLFSRIHTCFSKIHTHFQLFRPKWLKSLPYFGTNGFKKNNALLGRTYLYSLVGENPHTPCYTQDPFSQQFVDGVSLFRDIFPPFMTMWEKQM